MKTCMFFFCMFLFVSCTVQKQLTAARNASATTKKIVQKESAALDTIQKTLQGKTENKAVDSVVTVEIQTILNKLNSRLNSAQQLALLLDAASVNKATLRRTMTAATLLKKLIVLDSFNNARKQREEVYAMLKESVSTAKYRMYHLAAFFDPGVYRIPSAAIGTIAAQFAPVVDSIAYIANKYPRIPREARIVFVGYSDNTPLMESGALYKELTGILNNEKPTEQELNQLLSDLRAKEMVRNIKLVVKADASKFADFNSLTVGYMGYGRGEEFPSSTITDYKPRDERRRIVLSYWIVLPLASAL
ncbi:MAG: hypothetical protein J7539_07870 [Niabella sp.]|nr:hypothetical protein [Niabella sp.]